MTLDFNDADEQTIEHKRIDTDDLRYQLLSCLYDVLFYLFPVGEIRGNQFVIGNIKGDKGDSLSITLTGAKAGLWHDFATGEGGDIFALWAACHGLDDKQDFIEVTDSITQWLGYTHQAKPIIQNRSVKKPSIDKLGAYDHKWDYHDVKGNLLACVYRYDTASGKQFRPWDAVVRKMQVPNPRPLYNQLGMLDESTVVLVEGEKCADALINIGICATTAMMGANAPIEKTDWSPLQNKHLLIWPDNDEAGKNYSHKVSTHLTQHGIAASVTLLNIPEDKPAKWDAADAVVEKLDIKDFIASCSKTEHDFSFAIAAYSVGHLLDDKSPMPEDLIAPRVLTPGGLMVFGGAPKVGKSDFLLSQLAHMAAGACFLGLTPPRPLRIFYLQAEIGYHYLRERIQNMTLDKNLIPLVRKNLVITPQFKMLLNQNGVAATHQAIKHHFGDQVVDIIVVDPLRNVFDGGEDEASENDNAAMLFFLQQRLDALRDAVNPDAGIILAHHTRKIQKKQLEEDSFQALSGASSLRGYYSTGLIMFQPDEDQPMRQIVFELRNGPKLASKLVDKHDGKWVEINPLNERLVRADMGAKYDAERDRKHDVILSILFDEAAQGRLYTTTQFCEAFENKSGLGSRYTIRERISVLATKGYIKYRRDFVEHGFPSVRSRFGYLCVEDMVFGHETAVDAQTGEVFREGIAVLPTHFKCPHSGLAKEVENPKIWIYLEGENA